MTKRNTTIAILGAGSWGTAIAIHLAKAGLRVLLWGKDKNAILQMKNQRCNARYLPHIPFPETLFPETDLSYCLKEADEICIGVPSHAFDAIFSQLSPPPQHGLIWLTKGMDPETHQLLSEKVKEKWGRAYPCAIVSGPSFAFEVAKGLPTALTIASDNATYQQSLMKLFQHHNMRVYFSQDLIGVQLCGIVKNVLAIACGMSDGLNFGSNTNAALITRGLAEMRRLGTAMGAKEDTFMSLAGLGDLVLTCTDNQSRNRRFGLAIGQGLSSEDAMHKIDQVVEGFHNASQVMMLASKYHVSMPICEAVHQVLQGKCSAKQAAKQLIERTSLNPHES